jgi:hypothetical protein
MVTTFDVHVLFADVATVTNASGFSASMPHYVVDVVRSGPIFAGYSILILQD